MTTIYKYRIWCNTDSVWEYVWSETLPDKCPTNTAHSIDANMTTIIQFRKPDTVAIKEEEIPTGGHFQFKYEKISTPANQTSVTNISYPINVNVVSVQLTVTSSHNNDKMTWTVNPDTVVGVTTSNSSASDTTFDISPTVNAYTFVGCGIKITDGVNTDDLGIIISKTDTTITTSTPATNAFSAGAAIMMTVYFVDEAELSTPQTFAIGSTKIGSSYLPKGVPIVCTYENNNMLVAKTLDVYLQVLY